MPTPALRHLPPALLMMALATAVAAQEDQPVTRAGKRVSVLLHAEGLPGKLADRLADEAFAQAESALPMIDKLLGSRDNDPITLHVYSQEKAFRDVERQLAPRRFLREDFSLPQAAVAHVALWPQLPRTSLERVGLPSPTADALVRHTAQLVVAQRQPAAAADPWLAEVFGFGVLETLRNPKGLADVDLPGDTRRFAAAWRVREGHRQGLAAWIEDETPGSRDDHDELQADQAIFSQLLRDKSASWAKKMFAKKPKDGTDPRAIRKAALEAVLGSDWLKTEARLDKLLREQDPTFRIELPMVHRDGDRTVIAGTKAMAGILYAQRDVPTGPFVVSMQLTATADCDFRVQLPWRKDDVLGIQLTEGQASFDEWVASTNKWTPVRGERTPMQADQPIAIRIEVRGEVQLFVGEELVLRQPATDLGTKRPVGFACNFGVATLTELRIEPLPAGK